MDIHYLQPPDCDTLELASATPNTYRKQVIYAGQFTKTEGKGVKQRFKVDKQLLLHWERIGNEMLTNNIGVPMPSLHTDEPEAKRADIVRFEFGKDSKNRDALFVHFSFVSGLAPDTLAALKASDVSIFVPPEWTDGNNKKYDRPIRHVAFTNSPVIPGLDPTTALAASFEENTNMTMAELAQALGLQVEDGADDSAIGQAIIDAVTNLKKSSESGEEALPPSSDTQGASPAPSAAPTPPVTKETVTREFKPLAAGFVNMAIDSRQTKLDSLVSRGKITPAMSKKLAEQYATAEPVGLALSDDGTFSDGFDSLIETLELNQAIELGERTQHQALPAEKNPLLQDAKRRAEAAQNRPAFH